MELLRGVAYGALPCSPMAPCEQMPEEDDMQAGYKAQWGPDGRDDLGQMRRLGANAVRLYHSMGAEHTVHDHGAFLDRAHEVGIDVLPGFHSDMECNDSDCYEPWKAAAKAGFEAGFKQGGGWHPAVSAVILLNEPDFSPCVGEPAGWCRVKKALSALEGLLDAEKEAGVSAGRVQLTITWSFALLPSIDSKVTGPGIFGFQDMVAGIADPSIAYYRPRGPAERLQQAFAERWTHGLNTQAPWDFVKESITKDYDQFLPHRWFIGEYGANGQTNETIVNDLKHIQSYAKANNDSFWGSTFFQFQVAYENSGSGRNFGMYSLGNESVGNASDSNSEYAVYCLSTDLAWLNATPALKHRAEAVASAWGGSAEGKGLCKDLHAAAAPAAFVV